MTILSPEAVADFAWQAGFRGDPLITMVAVTGAESGYDTDQLGDTTLETAIWGPSVGLGQVRSLRAELNKGTDRDENANHDPLHNLTACFHISQGGTNFKPWSTYTTNDPARSYTAHLPEARAAAGKVSARGGSPNLTTAGPASTRAFNDYITTTDDQLHPVADLYGDGGALGGAFIIRGRALTGDIDDYVTGGNVDLDVAQVWQVELAFDDPALTGLAQSGLLDIGTPVDYLEFNMIVAAVRISAGPAGSEQVTVTLRTAGAEAMKQDRAPRGTANVTGAQFATDEGNLHGLVTVSGKADGTPFAVLPIGRNPANAADPTSLNESSWEAVQRVGKEAGVWVWESGYHELNFVTPTYAASRNIGFRVEWRTDNPYLAPVECPDCRRTNDDPLYLAEISVLLPPGRGRQVRPGMRLTLVGIHGFEESYIVTRVHWELDGAVKPVTVTAVTPRDPLPTKIEQQQLTPELVRATAGTKSALDFVNFALKQAGTRYVYGAKPDLDNPHPAAFDCSELVQWAAHQVGVEVPRTSGQQYAACKAAGTTVDLATAYKTRGALLFIDEGQGPGGGHVAISLGDGNSTIEARGRQYGVLVVPNETVRGFDRAGLLPGLSYNGVDASTAANPVTTRFGPN